MLAKMAVVALLGALCGCLAAMPATLRADVGTDSWRHRVVRAGAGAP